MDTLTRMRIFLQVTDSGGFTAAAKITGRSKALISRYVSELEDELGVRLLNRTTRQISLTEAGEHYYRDAQDILSRLDDLMVQVQDTNASPRGRLKISLPRTMGDGALGHALINFAEQYQDLELSVSLDDRFVNLVEDGYDAAIRVADLDDSSLIAKKIGTFQMITCASPSVLAKHGRPLIPQDLTDKPCIIDCNLKPARAWSFLQGGKRQKVQVKSRIELNSPTTVRMAALAGLGFARIPRIFTRSDLEQGHLVEVLESFVEQDRTIYVVYPHRRHLPNKTRVFVDFIADWFEHNEVTLGC